MIYPIDYQTIRLPILFRTVEQYLTQITRRYQQGNATEHTFRGDLQQLVESLVPDIRATNEAKRQACGAPGRIISFNLHYIKKLI
ncbi:hypothetical protein [Adhaeribacter arboris]|uniref:hypothetical protein n=1 Tax=Adhaeribacter arboris TaxID=2072846 RepID=UPI0018EAF1E2|nr:hypothetical protein [Adhaeribacter arboris]